VPPRIKVTTLESQLIHLIQELSGRTLRTAKALGVQVPDKMLAIADEVVE
jgi:hypothetical protein